MWDPDQYLRYADYRSRPFQDLLDRVGADRPVDVIDLGCGPGHLSPSILGRWPETQITGVDDSAAMIDAARAAGGVDRVTYRQCDIRHFEPDGPVDVVLSNAALHWLPDHLELLHRFMSWLRPGGWLAIQVPGNHAAPSYTELADLRLSPRWRHLVGDNAESHIRVHEPVEYARKLAGPGVDVDVWETTYVHVLSGVDPVFEWVSGSMLRPVLAALDEADAAEFGAEYKARLDRRHPTEPDGTTLFRFRRIFAVARSG